MPVQPHSLFWSASWVGRRLASFPAEAFNTMNERAGRVPRCLSSQADENLMPLGISSAPEILSFKSTMVWTHQRKYRKRLAIRWPIMICPTENRIFVEGGVPIQSVKVQSAPVDIHRHEAHIVVELLGSRELLNFSDEALAQLRHWEHSSIADRSH
jgi:hypothetical protein